MPIDEKLARGILKYLKTANGKGSIDEKLVLKILKYLKSANGKGSEDISFDEICANFRNTSKKRIDQHIYHADKEGLLTCYKERKCDGSGIVVGVLVCVLTVDGTYYIKQARQKFLSKCLSRLSPLGWIIFGAIAASHAPGLFEVFLKWIGIGQ